MQIKNKGFSLIEILVALGIFSFVSLAFASFISQTVRELRAANQKTEMLSFERDLETALRLDMNSCSGIVGGLSFNRGSVTGTSGPVIQIPNGLTSSNGTVLAAPNQPLLGTTTGLRVARTELEVQEELPSPNDHIYRGILRVALDPDSTIRSFVPTESQIWFEVDPNSPAGSREIEGCAPAVVASPCDVDQIQVGTGTGQAICTSMAQLIADAFQNLTCPPNTLLAGVNPDGTPICSPMPNMGGGLPPPLPPGPGTGPPESTTKSCTTSGRGTSRICEVYCDPGWTRTSCIGQRARGSNAGRSVVLLGNNGCRAEGRCGPRTCDHTTAILTCIR